MELLMRLAVFPRSTVAVVDLVDQVAALEQRISQLEERLRE
jgi:hypothetical protein